MKRSLRLRLIRCVSARFVKRAVAVLSFVLLATMASPQARADDDNGSSKIKRVLLISIDGMHSLDMATFIKSHPASALAQLAAAGVNYTAAATTKPSDSIPPMAGTVTGGPPPPTRTLYHAP